MVTLEPKRRFFRSLPIWRRPVRASHFVALLVVFLLIYHFYPKQSTAPLPLPASYFISEDTDPFSNGTPPDDTLPALTSLGPSADAAFDLQSTSLDDYQASLESFITTAFPASLHKQLTQQLRAFLSSTTVTSPVRIPAIIWQTHHTRRPHTESYSWRLHNPHHEYRFADDEAADAWVRTTLRGSEMEWVWEALPVGVLKADLWRYLVLFIEGGMYSDTDTRSMKPVSLWGTTDPMIWPPGQQDSEEISPPGLIVGIEADVGEREDWAKWWPRPLQITQWTIASAPGHPVLLDAIRRIHRRTIQVERRVRNPGTEVPPINPRAKTPPAPEPVHAQGGSRTSNDDNASTWDDEDEEYNLDSEDDSFVWPWLRPAPISKETLELRKLRMRALKERGGWLSVMEWTGPGVFTDSVIQYLMARHGLPWPALRSIEQPLRCQDIVILPVTGFSPEVGAFGAGDRWHPQAMVLHRFAGSWKRKSRKVKKPLGRHGERKGLD